MRPIRCHGIAVGTLTLCISLLCGCSSSFAPGPELPVQTAFGTISGHAYGGQQPITGARIYALQSGIGGYGAYSVSLLGASDPGGYPTTSNGSGAYYVTTDSQGYFEISPQTTCTSGRIVFLLSSEGDATPGVENDSITLLAVLGTCPASGLLINAITTGTAVQIYINEVSTVAAAYALAGFATSVDHIATDGSMLGATGIQNAAANAAQLYTAVATSGSGTGDSRSANSVTPNGNGTVPQAELDTLANILASCINSSGETSTACVNLRNLATSDGTSTGTLPVETATAAINIAHNPTANVTKLFNLVGSTANPFMPALATAPNDFTVSLSFTGGGQSYTYMGTPHGVAIDSSGNVWASSIQNNAICKFSPLGVPANSTGFTGNGLNQPISIAVDAASAYVLVANYGGNVISRFTIAGVAVNTFAPGGNFFQDVAFDGSGNIWVAADSNQVDKVSTMGTVLGTSSANGLKYPNGIAIEGGATGDVWAANPQGTGVSVFTNAVGVETGSPYTNPGAYGVAIDAAGNAWTANWNGTISEYTSAGATVSGSPFSIGPVSHNFQTPAAQSIAIDGSGNVWVTSQSNSSIYELSNAGVVLSTSAGFVPNPAATPDSIAIDGSGNVWYDNQSDETLRELIGAATPVITPIALAVYYNKLGVTP